MNPLYAFIGGGNMGRALVGGLIAAGHPPAKIRVSDPEPTCREYCAERFGVEVFERNADAMHTAEVVVLAVKPQQMRDVAVELAGVQSSDPLYISIAAGITIRHLSGWLGEDRAIVRCMPNTPALVGCGAAGLIANAHVSADQQAIANQLLEAVGIAVWLDDEHLMDAVTALSGSGPAYFFLLFELLERAAVDLGLPAPLARSLAIETARGASVLAGSSNDDPATLRKQVTSPGGTTERALAAFEAAGLGAIVNDALRAAHDRSIELARQVDA